MSTGSILSVLSHIPWGQVVENAPKVADGAAKLWSSVTGLRTRAAPPEETSDASAATQSDDTEALRARIDDLEETVRNLSEQMQASSELIKALADQNTQLVERIELNRRRLTRVGAAAAAAFIGLAAVVGFLALRA